MRLIKMIGMSTAAVFVLAGCTTVSNNIAAPQNTTPPKLIEGPVGFGQTAYVDGPAVTPLQLLEDSRCPAEVNCVWAGQVRIKVRVTGGSWSKEMELTNGKPVHVADGALTLINITPERRHAAATSKEDYRFIFSFQGGF